MSVGVQAAPRLLILIDETSDPSAQDVAARRFSRIAEGATDKGVEIAVALLRGSPIVEDRLRRAGATVFSLNCSGNRALPLAPFRLKRALKSFAPDVVQSFEVVPTLVSVLSRVLDRKPRRVFFRSHTSSEGLHALLSRVAGRFSHLSMGGSKAVMQHAQALDRTPPHKTCSALNGVVEPVWPDSWEGSEARDLLRIDASSLVVGTVARLRREKGLRYLAEALNHLDFPGRVEVVLVGDGPELDSLRDLTKESRAQWHFVGHKSRLAPWYELMDVVVIPSEREAFCLTAAEAMSMSKPVIASSVGGLKEVVVNDATGLLVPPRDPQALAQALQRLLEDATLRESMGKAGRELYLENMTIPRMIERWFGCFGRVSGPFAPLGSVDL